MVLSPLSTGLSIGVFSPEIITSLFVTKLILIGILFYTISGLYAGSDKLLFAYGDLAS